MFYFALVLTYVGPFFVQGTGSEKCTNESAALKRWMPCYTQQETVKATVRESGLYAKRPT